MSKTARAADRPLEGIREGELLGAGLYSIPEASRLTTLPSSTLRRWLAGYSFRYGAATRRSKPVVRGTQHDSARVVTFLDLVELLVVRGFRSAGVRLQDIRTAAETAAEFLAQPHPLAFEGLKTDGRHIFAKVLADRGYTEVLNLSKRAQAAFPSVVEGYLRDLDYDLGSGYAKRWWPRGRSGLVVVDPEIAFGAPHIANAGVPTRTLYESSLGEEDVGEIARWFLLGKREVRAALLFEQGLEAA